MCMCILMTVHSRTHMFVDEFTCTGCKIFVFTFFQDAKIISTCATISFELTTLEGYNSILRHLSWSSIKMPFIVGENASPP